ncbi:hypothetical protein RUM44_006235 [Polyplax serrata]|uniref:Uncharacterized protein n=1 Tax=Polyplax serrata TaxID=468196 RepID=A0ABR1AJ90_POLSC
MEVLNSCLLIVLIFVAVVSCVKPPTPEDIGTNFFLKASKSVPRIGRRTVDYENYFLKSIPRIGRRTVSEAGTSDWMSKTYFEPMKKNFFEKYYKGDEQPGWSELEKLYLDYPGTFPPEDSYPDLGSNIPPEPYWKRMKKPEYLNREQPQGQTK